MASILINALLVVLAVVGLIVICFFIEMRSEVKYYTKAIAELKERLQAVEDKIKKRGKS